MYFEHPSMTQARAAVRLATQARRRQLEAWQQHFDALLRARVIGPEERLAQAQAIELMKLARP